MTDLAIVHGNNNNVETYALALVDRHDDVLVYLLANGCPRDVHDGNDDGWISDRMIHGGNNVLNEIGYPDGDGSDNYMDESGV
jgi:hypothetical protein